ncbi:MAG: lipoprotein [Cytophagaceae bacterium]
MKKIVFGLSILAGLSACSSQETTEETAKSYVLTPVWTSDTTLKVPESVIYNPADGYLYVSNIDGKPDSIDGKGFISQMTLDGKISKLVWCTGLDAPKGMGIYNGKLYVTDINKLVIIDIATAAIEKKIEVPGTKFLNDITIDGKGNVFITDSYNPDMAIYVYSDGVVNPWKAKGAFAQPNGVYYVNGDLYMADMGNGKFYLTHLPDTNFTEVAKDITFGDGVNQVDDSTFIISCWPGEVYIAQNGVSTKILDTKEVKQNAADAWYIKEKNLYLVPTFFANTVMAYKIEQK